MRPDRRRVVDVGIVRETKDGERRVALTPAAVAAVVRSGAKVGVETGAGAGAGFDDDAYARAGAEILSTAETWAAATVVKVKEPQRDELPLLRRGGRLFGFLHLAADGELERAIGAAGVDAYAFEDVEIDGRRPILAPMSQVAGRAAGIIGPGLLSTVHGGRGVLPGGVDGAAGARAVVIGAGVAGTAAAASLTALGMTVTAVDVERRRAEHLLTSGYAAEYAESGTRRADEATVAADLVVGAALIPGRRAPVVVRSRTVRRMRPGSVIVDIAIDQGGCVEGVRPTSLTDPTYVEDGVVMYCVPNIPGQYPRTATEALSAAVRPHLLDLASGRDTEALRGALAVGGAGRA